MKSLTRLLEAVFTRPGSNATDAERMFALSVLSTKAHELGTVVARVAGDDADRSQYVRAMAMDAAVSLVCKAWEQGRDIDWEPLIESASTTPEVMQAAEELALAVYSPVVTQQDAADRMAVSMHEAFWKIFSLGATIDGVTPKLTAEMVRDCAGYLQGRERFVVENSLYVSWMQGSIRRLTDLVCAEMRARFDHGIAPTKEDIVSVLEVARSGFEGVENYAQSILEKSHPTDLHRPADR